MTDSPLHLHKDDCHYSWKKASVKYRSLTSVILTIESNAFKNLIIKIKDVEKKPE